MGEVQVCAWATRQDPPLAPPPAIGEEEVAAEVQTFKSNQHTELLGEAPPPALRLDSVLAVDE